MKKTIATALLGLGLALTATPAQAVEDTNDQRPCATTKELKSIEVGDIRWRVQRALETNGKVGASYGPTMRKQYRHCSTNWYEVRVDYRQTDGKWFVTGLWVYSYAQEGVSYVL